MANIDLGNLTRYDGKIKQYTEDKYLSKNTANWQMTEKAEIVTCYPVPDTELEPIVDFSFKEVSPASGIKSPTNPSTIKGVNNIKVRQQGSNLIYPYSLYTAVPNGVTYTPNSNGTITANGTCNSTEASFFSWAGGLMFLPKGLTYTLSGSPVGSSADTYSLRFGNGSYDEGYGKTFTMSLSETEYLAIRVKINTTVNNVVFRPQLNLGSEILPFEPAIVNDYTVSLGNTYYGGSVNLATGMMTVTWAGKEITGTENWQLASASTSEINEFYVGADSGFLPMTNTILTSTRSCSHFSLGNANIVANTFYTWGSATRAMIRMSISDMANVTAFKSWLATQYANATPVTITYMLATPYTVQLTPMKIKSLFALDKNTPRLNTLYTDADSIQVGYQKHPARTSYELENAILALGGGE